MNAYPAEINLDRDLLVRTVDALVACAQACTDCADACLSEATVDELRKCIRTNLDCADFCATTARVLSQSPDHACSCWTSRPLGSTPKRARCCESL